MLSRFGGSQGLLANSNVRLAALIAGAAVLGGTLVAAAFILFNDNSETQAADTGAPPETAAAVPSSTSEAAAAASPTAEVAALATALPATPTPTTRPAATPAPSQTSSSPTATSISTSTASSTPTQTETPTTEPTSTATATSTETATPFPTSGTVTLLDRQTFDPVIGAAARGGAFYFTATGGLGFFANNYAQIGIFEFGDIGATDLNTITPPATPASCERFDCKPYQSGVDAVVGRTYVALVPLGYAGEYIFFHVIAVSPESVTFNYLYD